MLTSFKELLVWKKSYALVIKLYKATTGFPSHEMYGLTSQVRRAAISVPSNIAEGYTRGHTTEYIRFARIAFASVAEIQTQIMIAHDLGYLDDTDFQSLDSEYTELVYMLSSLIKGLTKNLSGQHS